MRYELNYRFGFKRLHDYGFFLSLYMHMEGLEADPSGYAV